MKQLLPLALVLVIGANVAAAESRMPQGRYFLNSDNTHNKFSRTIPPVLRVASGVVIAIEARNTRMSS